MKQHILKNKQGSFQGYVGVLKGHPLYGKEHTEKIEYSMYNDLLNETRTHDELLSNKGIITHFLSMFESEIKNTIGYQFDVHGGITYSGFNFWDMEEIERPNHPLITKYEKVLKLADYTGNDLFMHYYNKGIRKFLGYDRQHPNYEQAKRVDEIYKNLTKIELDLGSEILESNMRAYYDNDKKRVVYLRSDSEYWYFGWDSGHFGDTPEKCNYEYAVQETEKLKNQIESWTIAYYDR